MKKLSFFLLSLVVVMIACKKSGSDNSTPVLDGKNCKILTMSTSQTGYSSLTWFYYNGSGNLLYTKGTSSQLLGDTSIGTQYKYQDNILQYSFSNPSTNFSDTVFYSYDGSNKLKSTLEQSRAGTTLWSTKTDYFYNSSNQVIHTLARSTMDTAFSKVDSIIYSYTGNNVTKYTLYERTANDISVNLTIDISYDNMKNFYKCFS